MKLLTVFVVERPTLMRAVETLHVSTATWRSDATTACGLRIPVSFFVTAESVGAAHVRAIEYGYEPEFCKVCCAGRL